jgi:hypothetical protein
MDVRVCLPAGSFMEVKQSPDGSVQIEGPFSPWADVFAGIIKGLNATAVTHDSLGVLIDKESQTYGGCVGSLQQNESDVMFGPLTFLVVSDNITNGVVEGFERVGISSAYINSNMTRDSKQTHVLDMVYAFSNNLWLLLLFLFLLMLLLLTSSKSLLSGRQMRTVRLAITRAGGRQHKPVSHKKAFIRSLTVVVACILKQHSSTCGSVKKSFNLLYLCTSFLGWMCGLFLASKISTEMVVVKPPVVIENYQDILDSGVRPTWSATLTDKDEFENAAEGTMEWKVWHRAIDMGLEDSVLAAKPETVMKHGYNGANGKELFLIQKLFGERMFPYAMCAFARTKNIFSNTSVLYRHDPVSKERLKWNVHNRLMSKDVSKLISNRIQRHFESQILTQAMKYVDFSQMFGVDGVEQNYRAIQECYSDVVILDKPLWSKVNLEHYFTLDLLIGSCLIVVVIMFCFEVMYKRLRRNT